MRTGGAVYVTRRYPEGVEDIGTGVVRCERAGERFVIMEMADGTTLRIALTTSEPTE